MAEQAKLLQGFRLLQIGAMQPFDQKVARRLVAVQPQRFDLDRALIRVGSRRRGGGFGNQPVIWKDHGIAKQSLIIAIAGLVGLGEPTLADDQAFGDFAKAAVVILVFGLGVEIPHLCNGLLQALVAARMRGEQAVITAAAVAG